MSARLERWLRNIPVYRVDFNDLVATSTAAGSTAIFCEILGAAGRITKLRHFQFSKPTLACAPVLVNINSAPSTTSTNAAAQANMQLNPSQSTYAGIVRLYTSAPDDTAATVFNRGIVNIDVSTGEVLNEAFGDRGAIANPTITSGQSFSFCIGSTAGVTVNGYVEFTMEPYT